MNPSLAVHGPAAIDLNVPGNYLTWSIFTISEANLVLIAVMACSSGCAASATRCPRHHVAPHAGGAGGTAHG